MLINNYTGELYDNPLHAAVTIVRDMITFKPCRTIRMLSVSKYKPEPTWPSRWWEPGAEDAPEALPKDQWLPDDIELPFE